MLNLRVSHFPIGLALPAGRALPVSICGDVW
jgi:hypothetical protein